jgi:phosphoglycolate phosphatase-like HAD superfamily hydrolase
MIDDLLKYWPIIKEKSLMIGDSNIDELAAKKSNLKFKYIQNINKND